MRTRLAVVALTATALLNACGGPRMDGYTRALAEGDRAGSSGRHREAASRYDAAAHVARDRRDAAHAGSLAAMAWVRAADLGEAMPRLRALAAGIGDEAVSAKYWLGKLNLERGDPEVGIAALEEFFKTHPESGLARPAFGHVLRARGERGDERNTLTWLSGLRPAMEATELGETIAYALAKQLERLGDRSAARDGLLEVARRWPYPRGKLHDDALFHASELDEDLGRYREAAEHLAALLRERETTTIIGSYERPKYDVAMLRLARLQRDRLQDAKGAIATFHALYATLKTSPLRDDALWEEAAVHRTEGNPKGACTQLERLVKEFPHSRYVPCSASICPAATRPIGSQAPNTCRAYLDAR